MDNTPPRNGLILFFTLLAVLSLVALKFVLDSYFDQTWLAEVQENLDEGWVELEVTPPEGVEGDAAADMDTAIQAALPGLRTCYAELIPNPGIYVRNDYAPPVGTIRTTLRSTGGVTSATGTDDSEIGLPDFTRCVTSSFEALRGDGIDGAQVAVSFAETRSALAKTRWFEGLNGSRPIDRTMAELGRRGRGAFAEIQPRDEHDDRDAVRGWNGLDGVDPWQERFEALARQEEAAAAAAAAAEAAEGSTEEGVDPTAPITGTEG